MKRVDVIGGYLPTSSVAKRLKVSVARIQQLAAAGTLPPALVGPGGWRYWREADVADYLRSKRMK